MTMTQMSSNAVTTAANASPRPNVSAVSYTHLDVYKRQVVDLAVEDNDDAAVLIGHGLSAGLGQVEDRQAAEAEGNAAVDKPVSYTHLDVYKRQRHR